MVCSFHVLLSLSHVLRFCNSSNAIKHLASADHLKNLKHFLWKYGGDMERLNNYRILEADEAKVVASLYFLQRSNLLELYYSCVSCNPHLDF